MGGVYPKTCAECGLGPCKSEVQSRPGTTVYGLTPKQAELLAMLAEEAAEIGLAAMKILRHGYESYHPDRPTRTNRLDLAHEIGDLIGIMRRMVADGDLDGTTIEVAAGLKWNRARRYTYHQGGAK